MPWPAFLPKEKLGDWLRALISLKEFEWSAPLFFDDFRVFNKLSMLASTTGWFALFFLFEELLIEPLDPPLISKFFPEFDLGIVEEGFGS